MRTVWIFLGASALLASTGCLDSRCTKACKKAHDECDLPGSTEACIAGCGRGDPKAKKQWTERVLGRSCKEIRDYYFEQK